MIHTRRKFLTGLGSLLAAPAIVHAGNLMPVKAYRSALQTVRDALMPYGQSPLQGSLPDLRILIELRQRINAIMWIDLEYSGFRPDLAAKFTPPDSLFVEPK